MPSPVEISVPARAALAGNPSDLYRGAVLAVPVRAFSATARVADPDDLDDDMERPDASPLVEAARARVPQSSPYSLEWASDIPRTVGLAGSSAIVIAVLRALAIRAGVAMTDAEVAQLALEVETDSMGIVAGIQDRAVQATAAPVLVDVAGDAPTITPLVPARPLTVVIAWRDAAAGESGSYHRSLRDGAVDVDGMNELARIARAAATAFGDGDAVGLSELMGESAAVRRVVAPLSSAHDELADAVASTGLQPNSAGSGGAVAAVVTDDTQVQRLPDALGPINGAFVVERYSP